MLHISSLFLVLRIEDFIFRHVCFVIVISHELGDVVFTAAQADEFNST